IIWDEGSKLDVKARQAVAITLGFSESVFVNNLTRGSISIYTPQNEIPFAGHAAVGAARAIGERTGVEVKTLAGLKNQILTWVDGKVVWVRSDLASTPPWWHERLESPEEIVKLDGPLARNQGHTQLWAWLDEDRGRIRSRTFASD